MENRNRTQFFGLNLFACIAAVALAVAVVGYAYFQFRAREREAESMRQATEMMSNAMKASGDYWKAMDKTLNTPTQTTPQSQPTDSPTLPASDEPPARLPRYGTP